MNGITKFLILSIICFVVSPALCGCQARDENLIKWQPSTARANFFQTTKKQGTSVTKAGNGVIIIKDNSVVNKAGVDFGDMRMPEANVGNIRFDAEHFKTRY